VLPPPPLSRQTVVGAASLGGFTDDNDLQLKDEATDLIYSAAVEAGAEKSKLSVEWRPGIVTVIVGGLISLGVTADDYDESDDDLVLDEEDEVGVDDEEEEIEIPSIISVARAINTALYLDSKENGVLSVGNYVATTHEIEVTTPGAPEIVEGEVMFEAYRGFDVIVETNEVKKGGKKRVVEGKLVERDDQFTRVNVKGRVVKVKSENVEVIRLPKAKREKGAR